MSQPANAQAQSAAQRRVFTAALTLNLIMFVVGLVAGLIGQSSGLIADSLDMLADACGYIIALVAIERSLAFKARTALFSGAMLLVLGGGVLIDVVRRVIVGSNPTSLLMIGAAALSLMVNAYVLHLLRRFREGEIHLRTAYIDTKVDVIANLGVVLAGIVVLVTGYRYADLVVGAAIGIYVVKEALELIEHARDAQSNEMRED